MASEEAGSSETKPRVRRSSGSKAERATTTTTGGPDKTNNDVVRRTVCDHCRRRRIRCDGDFPCQQCINATLTCKREHVPRKRGPKRGHGRIINELRAREAQERARASGDPSAAEHLAGDSSAASHPPWTFGAGGTPFSTNQYRPYTRNYAHLVPQCIELYYKHIYPIMPLLHMPTIETIISQPLVTNPDKHLIYAICALTCFHMSGKSIPIQVPGPDSWEVAGRFFLDECILVRHSYDYLADLTLSVVITNFCLSTSFFEINDSRRSFFYLREALTLALDLGLHDDSTYAGLSPEESICRQRVFWQLFVTERSFAIFRNKPITFKQTPSLPRARHPYEPPHILAGFLQLISSYIPLDEYFVTAWNASDPRISASTYLALQERFSAPPTFLAQSRESSPTSGVVPTARPLTLHGGSSSATAHTSQSSSSLPFSGNVGTSEDGVVDGEGAPEPSAIQKADLLITQQWLRLIVWRSSFKQGLLSWGARHESMHFAFPLAIARRTAEILQSLPSLAVEVHGMGIFEKVFEIGTWCINVLDACDNAAASRRANGGPSVALGLERAGITGMDFVSGGSSNDLGVLGVGRKGSAIDPIEFFVRTLSASPNSRTQFAQKLLLFAKERPSGLRMALSPVLQPPGRLLAATTIPATTSSTTSIPPYSSTAAATSMVTSPISRGGWTGPAMNRPHELSVGDVATVASGAAMTPPMTATMAPDAVAMTPTCSFSAAHSIEEADKEIDSKVHIRLLIDESPSSVINDTPHMSELSEPEVALFSPTTDDGGLSSGQPSHFSTSSEGPAVLTGPMLHWDHHHHTPQRHGQPHQQQQPQPASAPMAMTITERIPSLYATTGPGLMNPVTSSITGTGGAMTTGSCTDTLFSCHLMGRRMSHHPDTGTIMPGLGVGMWSTEGGGGCNSGEEIITKWEWEGGEEVGI